MASEDVTIVIDAVLVHALHVWRCCSCGNIVAEIDLPPGAVVQIRCKCNAWNSAQTFADHQGKYTSFGGSTGGPIFQRAQASARMTDR